MNASNNVRTSSTPASAASLRPRTRRLISGLEEGDEATHDPSAAPRRIASPVPSPYDSRSVSPIPPTRLSRPTSSQASGFEGLTFTAGSDRGRRDGVAGARRGGAESPSLAGLWGTSWTALQGIASDLLGNDLAVDVKDKAPRPRKVFGGLGVRQASSSVPPGSWGPNAPTSNPSGLGLGTKQERENAVRAQKRKDMLTRQESSYLDTLGKFKRRTSEDHGSFSAPPGDNEDRDALVYLHLVQKNDTLAGITIKYNISANMLRKANRMWPNDALQVRKTLVLPVDACGVKGKLVANGEAFDLLSSESDVLSAGQAEEVVSTPTGLLPQDSTDVLHRDRTNSTNSSAKTAHNRTPSMSSSVAVSESPWEHDSWVLLPGNTKPTEIARLSRRTLGYFPPARRKSNCLSEFNTPSTSFELTRTGSQDPSNPSVMSPGARDLPQRPRRVRKLSNATNGYFPSYLAGPGGVGTMSKNVHTPGPAQDGLNKVFAKHLPDVAPPKNQTNLYQPDIPVYSDDPTPTASGRSTPAFPGGGNIDLANVGGAIEGWMRKVATQARSAMEKPGQKTPAAHMPRLSVGTPGRGARGVGDLIEMQTPDEFELSDDDYEEPSRGRQGSVVRIGPASSATSYFPNTATARAQRDNRESSKAGKDD